MTTDVFIERLNFIINSWYGSKVTSFASKTGLKTSFISDLRRKRGDITLTSVTKVAKALGCYPVLFYRDSGCWDEYIGRFVENNRVGTILRERRLELELSQGELFDDVKHIITGKDSINDYENGQGMTLAKLDVLSESLYLFYNYLVF